MLAINLQSISFSYDRSRGVVVDNINLAIPRGEVWALVGRSGTGKTTIIHLVAGLFAPEGGSIHVEGRSLGLGRIRGLVLQQDSLLGWLSVEHNLLFPHHRTADNGLRRRAAYLIESTGLSPWRTRLPAELSAGTRKRVEFARALMADQEFILADEPFGTVDAITRRNLWRLWKELRAKEPRTGLLCTHDAEEALRLCDAVVTLRPGPSARLEPPMVVPEEVRGLPIDQEDETLWSLKRQLISTL